MPLYPQTDEGLWIFNGNCSIKEGPELQYRLQEDGQKFCDWETWLVDDGIKGN